jgi:hypothetical protein
MRIRVVPKTLSSGVLSLSVTALLACTHRPQPTIDAMSTGWCDTTPLKPKGRVLRLPSTPALHPGFGAIIGVVSELETGDALPSSGVALVSLATGTGHSQSERASDANGGFAFDSVVPGAYEVRVRSMGHTHKEVTISVEANQLDTVRMRLPAYRCYGY